MKIAILIPCYNEEKTIQKVVTDFRISMPMAEIWVCDNLSSDSTGKFALEAGAKVLIERNRGKGHAVRRLFADVEADYYVMVDGDATYDANDAPSFVKRMDDEKIDFLNGARVSSHKEAYRMGHRLGNLVLTGLVRKAFGTHFSDMLSGYKVFSKRFVKSFPALSQGFEIETELTVHALELCMPCLEVRTHYIERPPGSFSKLRTFHDGFRILKLIAALVRNERPLQFFCLTGLFFVLIALILFIPILATFLETGLVPRIPTAILSASLVTVGFLCFAVGLILDTVTTARRELKRLAYLSVRR